MTEPASSFIATKLASMIGGLMGGATILTFIRPKNIGEAFIRGGVSVGSSIIFSAPLLNQLGMKHDWESQLMAGFIVGFVAYSLLGMVANFLSKNQTKDIVEVVKDTREDVSDIISGEKKP
jgi:hypothetical protein